MKQITETRTALDILQANAHRKVKYIANEHTAVAYAFYDVLAGGEAVFSLSEWHDRINPVFTSEETVGEWLASHPLIVAHWEERRQATDAT